MKDTITNYIKGCTTCQSQKNNPTNLKPPIFPITSDKFTLPFESIALDFIVKLPESNHYDTILTITDTFSKASIFIPCNETIDAEETALLYTTYVLPHYGLPSCIISDHDPRFTSAFTKELCRTLHIDQNITTAYHPQTDGQSERTNKWLEQYLYIFHQLPSERLEFLAPIGTIHSKRLAEHNNKESSFRTHHGTHSLCSSTKSSN